MTEVQTQKSEVPAESKELTKEDLARMVDVVETAATELPSFGKSIEAKSSSGATYKFVADVHHFTEGTQKTSDDSIGANITVYKLDSAGKLSTHTYLTIRSSRAIDLKQKGAINNVEVHLTEDDKSKLVAEVSCDGKTCQSTEGALVQAKIDELITGLLRPKLDEMKAERQRVEEERTKERERLEQEKLEKQRAKEKEPIDKVKSF